MPVQQVFTVELTEPMGADAVAWGSIAGRGFTIRLEAEYLPSPGAELAAGFDPARASLFDEETGLRL